MNLFGESDPREMPAHLFHDALKIDYDSAKCADISKQDFTVCPRHWYIDATFRCADCRSEFVFSAKEQLFWYEERKFYVDSQPKRCAACRKKERAKKKPNKSPEPTSGIVTSPAEPGAAPIPTVAHL
jgi:hypothetical protein